MFFGPAGGDLPGPRKFSSCSNALKSRFSIISLYPEKFFFVAFLDFFVVKTWRFLVVTVKHEVVGAGGGGGGGGKGREEGVKENGSPGRRVKS